jgi:mono/diheme cytochrome c family protein
MLLHGLLRAKAAGILRAALLTFVLVYGLAGSLSHVEAAPIGQSGTTGETIFQTKCVACHTIGKGKLVGPDLKGVTAQRDPQWLKAFIANPEKLFSAKDPAALKLLSEFNNVKMPALGLTDAEVDALVAYLGSSSSTAGSVAAPAAQASAVVGDPASGRRTFTGELALAGGGPSCIGCHTVSGIGGLGGGALGPDLTHAAQRYPGPGLAAVLGNIAFPTMVGPFANRPLTPQEEADLVAFLVQADQGQASAPPFSAGAITRNTWWVLGIGLVGTAALTLLLAVFWPRQRQSASARLRALSKSEER